MLLEITEIPHGFGQRKSTYTLVHTHSSCSKHSAEVCSLFLWSSSTLHISCHCLLKNFYFPYLNMLIYSQLSFRATWYPLHPTAAKSQFLSASLSVSFCVTLKTETSESYWILPTRFSVRLRRACCNICSSWGLYVFTGITQPAQTLPYEAHTEGNLQGNLLHYLGRAAPHCWTSPHS